MTLQIHFGGQGAGGVSSPVRLAHAAFQSGSDGNAVILQHARKAAA